MIEVTAPGKMLLSGEYAVLWGAPAVCATVECRARARFEPSAEGWWLDAPQLGVKTELTPEAQLPADERLRLVHTILGEAVGAARGETVPLEPQRIHIDTSAFYTAQGAKLGLGSSAAVAAALWGGLRYALLKRTPLQRDALVIEVNRLHRRVQGGVGSGVDVAAAIHGGIIRFDLMSGGWGVRLPAEVHLIPVWTGVPASTPDMVASVDAATGTVAEQARQVLVTRAHEAAEAINGTASAWVRTLERYGEALDELGRAAGVDIVSDVHRRIGRAVARAGGTYKPSGAGGGDIGFAALDDPDRHETVSRAIRAAGGEPLTVSLGAVGLDGPKLR